jgi:3-oxoacyl-[acyl-carrier-protein] synthase-3
MIRCGPGIGILGTGSYLPERVVGNPEVATRVGVDPEWISRKTEIMARRYAAEHEATSDLATVAARRALDAAGIEPTQIDFLIVSTSTGDSPQPPTAYLVQRQLGADRAACLDINVVCSGFVYGIALAEALLAQRAGARALVVAADLYSRSLDFDDRSTAGCLASTCAVGATRPT